MACFPLQILTPQGSFFQGQAEKLLFPTTEGYYCLLPRHMNFLAALSQGEVTLTAEGRARRGQCSGGFVTMQAGSARLFPLHFHWLEETTVP